jgi:lipopolysaccharide/colanic/teichoic acid biosynthesis glycosyltransferase
MRRAVNVTLALLLMILALPLMLLIAVALRLTSAGPVVYTQPRIGADRRDPDSPVPHAINGRRQIDLGGRIFTIFKFRTMHVGSDLGGQVWARPGDDRVTWVGRFLRTYHLDELPQFFNILNGDMNLVGPRPEQPAIFYEMSDQIPGYPGRQKVPPGLTGWAQIQHRYDRTLDDVRRKLELDLAYLRRRSPMEDMRILARTVPAVMLGTEAKGL